MLTSVFIENYNEELSDKQLSFKIRHLWNGEKQKTIQLY